MTNYTAWLTRCIIPVYLLLVLATYLNFSDTTIAFTEDMALTLAIGEHVAHGEPILLGPPSHIGGRHLGGLMYWLVGVIHLIGDGDALFASCSIALLSLLGILICSHTASLLFPRQHRPAALIASAIGMLTVGGLSFIRYPWANNLLMIFSGLFLYGALQVLERGRNAYPFFITTAILLGSLHFSTGPGVALVTCIVTWRLWRERGNDVSDFTYSSWVWCGVSALLLLPIVWFEVAYHPNIISVLTAVRSNAQAPAGFQSALSVGYDLFKNLFWGTAHGTVTRFAPHLLASVAVVTLSFFTLIRYRKEFPSWMPTYIGMLIALVVLYLYTVQRLSEPLYPSYFYPLLWLPPFLWGLCGCSLSLIAQSPKGRIVALGALVLIGCHTASHLYRLHHGEARHAVKLHSIEFTKSLAHDLLALPIPKPFTLLVPEGSFAHAVRGTILYHLGYDFHPYIEYWEEIDEFGGGPDSKNLSDTADHAVLVQCPKPVGKGRERMVKALSHQWIVGKSDLELPNCKACSLCLIRALERKPNTTQEQR
jgi:hypothetical protein